MSAVEIVGEVVEKMNLLKKGFFFFVNQSDRDIGGEEGKGEWTKGIKV